MYMYVDRIRYTERGRQKRDTVHVEDRKTKIKVLHIWIERQTRRVTAVGVYE